MNSNDLRLSATDGTTTTTVDIDVSSGARLRQVHIERTDTHVDLLATAPSPQAPWATSWGSFPMAPWAGRLRHGRFDVGGEQTRLWLNHQDAAGVGGGTIHPPTPPPDGPVQQGDPAWRQHTIHGTTFDRTWTVDEAAADRCELSRSLDSPLGWTFGGVARQRIEVSPSELRCTMSIEADGADFPAALGWHPWFEKPDRLDFTPESMYECDDIGLPTGRLVDPPPGPWDACFVTREPIRLMYERTLAPVITITSDCDDVVVFDMPAHATCVEPQSGPPDALNVRPEVVALDRPLLRTMVWSW